ncbi:ribonuclease H-like domain-containing protein [Xylariaceae sp. FL0594]|nr:ribonuclease H-like domain-containing protein [Xylariaceae sp. FL0594]
MEFSQDFKSLQENIQTALVSTTRLANQIAAEDLDFQRTSNPTIAEELDDASLRLLTLTSSLLKSATKGTDVVTPSLEDADDVDVHWSRIVDIVDNLLEKADTCLDEYTGAIKRKSAPADQQPAPPAKKSRSNLEQSFRHANVLKPQNSFEVKANNHEPPPWRPVLTKKPHATVPLEKSLEIAINDETQSDQYKHPYEAEILSLSYPKTVFEKKDPINYLPFESTTANFVDTFEGVLEMLEELKQATVIAIDTEHHDFRTYNGLLSLMQISTREKDWIVDTLQPWRHKLEVLNEVFANPKIIKVLHGAYMDIIWLQRDLGLYVVGLFDTYEAATALDYPGKSLAYLLKRFVDFDADKKYQLADWRIRPLPEEMFYYARSDTHYLLYVYDHMRNELLSSSPDTSLMQRVLKKSKETSLRRHETSAYDAENGQGPFGWFNMLLRQSSGRLSKEQFAVFRALHQWRDKLARDEDESPLFVMGNATLFDITRRLPPDPKALHSLIDAKSYLARRDVSNLFDIITKAIADSANGPTSAEFLRGLGAKTLSASSIARTVLPPPVQDAVDLKDLIATTSQLWGEVPVSSRWESTEKGSTPKRVEFELPWVKLLQSAKFAEDTSGSSPAEAVPETVKTETEPEPTLENTEFTLRAGTKRKAPENDEDESSSESETEAAVPEPDSATKMEVDDDDVGGEEEITFLDDSGDDKKATKKAKKKARKAQLRAQRQQAKERKAEKKNKKQQANNKKEDANTDADEEAPFDYAKAQSVLNANRNNKGNGNGQQQKKAKFNQFSQVNDGPKPARRLHGEKAGKSGTFTK